MAGAERVVPFADLASADLIVDALYDGGATGMVADDPLARLLSVGNQGGFRYVHIGPDGSLYDPEWAPRRWPSVVGGGCLAWRGIVPLDGCL